MAIRLKDRIEANIRQSDKVNNSLSINGKTYNGSAAISVGAIGVAYGGTGATTLSSKKVLFGNGTSAIKTYDMHINYSAGTTSTVGYEELVMGNSTASGTAGNTYGRLALYSSGTKGQYIVAAANSTDWTTHTLPVTGGTLLNTGTTSWTAADAKTAKVGTLKLNSTNNSLYDVFLYQRGANLASNSITDINEIKVPSVYYSNNSTETGTLTNPPPGIASGFRLVTLAGYQGTGSYSYQLAFSSQRMFWRKMGANNADPSSWYGFIPFVAGTAVGSANKPIYLTDIGTPTACNTFVPNTGGTFTGQITATSFKVESNARYYTAIYSTRKAQTIAAATYTSGTKTYTPKAAFTAGTVGYFGMLSPYVFTYTDSSDGSTGSSISGAYPMARVYSMNSSTGALLSYYWTFRTAAVDNDLTANATIYVPISTSSSRGGSNQCMYMSGGKLYSGNSFVPTTGGTFTGDLSFTRSTTIANNTPIKLNFTVTQTDNNVSNKAFIAVYDDLDTVGNGVNMVINATSGLYLTAGEGARDYLATYPSTSEQVHICADSTIYFHTNCNTTTNSTSSVYINTSGVLYGACWNDYAEYRDQNENIQPGYITYSDDDGRLKHTIKRLQKFEGVVSDTFGFAIGETEECKTPLAVSGRVLVYSDPYDHFHSGDCVCAGPGGLAYRMTREEIMMYPDRIVGVVSEIPTYETWGAGNVKVDGRIWIKVR